MCVWRGMKCNSVIVVCTEDHLPQRTEALTPALWTLQTRGGEGGKKSLFDTVEVLHRKAWVEYGVKLASS